MNGEDELLAGTALKLLESENMRLDIGARAHSLLVKHFSAKLVIG